SAGWIRAEPAIAVGAQPAEKPGLGSGAGSSLGGFDLAGGPTDRQTVASWFEPSGPRPQVLESVGNPAPPSWAHSLPLGLAVGSGAAFDEFSAPAGVSPAMSPGSQPGAVASSPGADQSAASESGPAIETHSSDSGLARAGE